jgi:hypothetical protein
VEFVVIWIGMGIIGIPLGMLRGRSPLNGFLWGFLLGPIGWLVVLLIGDSRPRCPECRGVAMKGARKCMNCGSLLHV